jgi:hypothetical protein
MRLLGGIVVAIAVGFIMVMGYFWWRDGSLQAAGAKMDEGLSKIDQTTQPLQDSVGKVGEGVKEAIDNASDGDDRT